jgi:hypothetical protein
MEGFLGSDKKAFRRIQAILSNEIGKLKQIPLGLGCPGNRHALP